MPIPARSVDCPITELERRQLIEWIEQALVEMDESDEISQGAIDGLDSALATLGAKQ